MREPQASAHRLAAATSEQRLTAALLLLADRLGVRRDGGVLINAPIGRDDIADLTGCAPETASRILARPPTEGHRCHWPPLSTSPGADEANNRADAGAINALAIELLEHLSAHEDDEERGLYRELAEAGAMARIRRYPQPSLGCSNISGRGLRSVSWIAG